MKKKIFNLGLVGTGKILKKHLISIKEFKKFNILAVHSRSSSKGLKFCTDNDISKNKYYANINEFIKIEEIDAFFICVSVESIDNILKKIIQIKKPFFIEKPPVVNLNLYSEVCKKIKKFNILNMVGLNRRFYSNLLSMRKLFYESGGPESILIEGNERIWQKKNINTFRKKNWLILNSIHTLDLIFFLCGDINKINYLKTSKNVFSLQMRSKRGCNILYTANWNSPGGWSIKMHNDKYYGFAEPLEKAKIKDKENNIKYLRMSKKDREFKPGFNMQITFFYKLLIEKKHTFPSIGLESCKNLYKVMEKIND